MPRLVQVNMLEVRNQLSRLVKAALAGEEVIIASHGKAQVKLVPCVSAAGLLMRLLLDTQTLPGVGGQHLGGGDQTPFRQASRFSHHLPRSEPGVGSFSAAETP
jgi:prevent-host-death family protein